MHMQKLQKYFLYHREEHFYRNYHINGKCNKICQDFFSFISWAKLGHDGTVVIVKKAALLRHMYKNATLTGMILHYKSNMEIAHCLNSE